MILEKISIKGFLSYIEEEVDLRGSHITLVSGQNGEGKSALLESIPFCFWGTGRGKSISDYMNDKCETIRIEAIVVMDGIRYKKIRQHGKNNINELYVDKNPGKLEDAQWKLMSDDTKKKTDVLWSSILGLDYDIFTNSVFFGQKESSSFIEGGAGERKELLSNLLGISVYEKAEEVAKEKAKDVGNSIQTKTVVLNGKLELVNKKQIVEDSLSSTKKRLKTIGEEFESVQEKIETIQGKREKIKVKIANLQKDKERLDSLGNQLKKLVKTKTQTQTDLTQSKEDLEATIDEGIAEVELINKIIEAEQSQIDQKKDIEDQIKVLESKKLKLPELKKQLDAHRTSKESLLSEQTEINTLIKSLNSKKKKIESSGPICPVIEQQCEKLTEESKQKTIEEIDIEKKKYEKKLEKIQENLTTTSNNILEIDQKIEAVSKVNEKILVLSKKLSTITSDLEKIAQSKEDLPKIKKKYRTLVDKLTESVNNFEERIKELTKDIESTQVEYDKLEEQTSTDLDEELNKVVRNLNALNEDKKTITDEKDSLTKKLGQLENENEQVKNAEADSIKIKKDIDTLQDDLRIYTELSLAFGQNGIQKEIINSNVPILEETANELLGRFTKDARFKIKFDLDPTTKSGKLKKKGGLDIIISERGKSPRELNMYSGGETVRIMFAILLSLSYLLTKRAGKKSQTLIIDERVAALDQEGVNQFIEIVKYIANQYKKIFIVSHISELKEAFPNMIEVNKSDSEGSKVTYYHG